MTLTELELLTVPLASSLDDLWTRPVGGKLHLS